MLTNAQGVTSLTLLSAGSKADTAAATGAAVDVAALEGPIIVVCTVASVGTSIAGALETGDAADGSDASALPGGAFSAITEATTQTLVIDANACKKYLRYKGTITGAACVLAVVASGKSKYV